MKDGRWVRDAGRSGPLQGDEVDLVRAALARHPAALAAFARVVLWLDCSIAAALDYPDMTPAQLRERMGHQLALMLRDPEETKRELEELWREVKKYQWADRVRH